MVEDNQADLEGMGSIRLEQYDPEEAKNTNSGFQPENGGNRAPSRSSQGSGIDGETFNTLDEPVTDTIVSERTIRGACF